MKFIKKILCIIGHHDWTSLSLEGRFVALEPSPSLDELTIAMNENSKLYCKHCNKELFSSEKYKSVFSLKN